MPKLKQFLTESEVTDDLKGAYTKQADGRYKLNDLSDDHALVVAQKEVTQKADERQRQIDTLTAAAGNLERERDEAKAKSIPHGFRAVAKEVAELGEAAKAANLSKDEVSDLKTKVEGYEQAETKKAALELRREAGKALGYANADAFARLAGELEIVKDGDKFTVKVGDEQKPLTKEFIQSHESFSPFLSSLAEKQKNTPFPTKESETTTNLFDKIREEVKTSETKEKVDIDARFGRPATV